jgi:phage shock protein PspC (stress-responsive transcriptional regulator)
MFCSSCGKSIAPEANFCPACGTRTARYFATAPSQRPIVRPRYPRAIAGVCSGVALHFGWDVMLTRILFAVLTVMTSGLGILVYAAAWVIFPDEPYTLPSQASGSPAR